MDNVTIGEIGVAVTFLVGLFTGIGYLHKHLKDWITKSLKDQLDSIDKKIEGLHARIDDVDMDSCKTFLVRYLSDIEKGNPLDEIEKERFWEQYQHYSKMGGNSYIRRKVDQLTDEGKL